jgi:hypothetical protein
MNRALASIVLSLILLTGITAGSVAFAESDEIELKGILTVIDDNTFELDTENGIETLSINDDTIIDDGLSLSELDGLVVDVDAIIIDDVLFATEIEFDSSQNDTEEETEDKTEDGNESDALEEINKAKREIQKADEKITDAADKGKDTELAVLKLDEAKELLVQAESRFDDGDFDAAEELAEEAKDLAAESRMKYLGKTTEDIRGDDKQSKKDEKLAKAQEKRDKKLAKAEEKRAEKLAKHEAKLLKAETRLAEKIAELETKLTERANISEERANKILEKITKETQKYDDRVLKLVDKFQSGKYFGDPTNTDKEIKSFVLSFDGTAAEISDQSIIETLTGEIFLENLLTGSHSKKFRVTGGSISIAEETDNAEVFDIVFGKARLSSFGSGGQKDSMIIIAQVDDGVDVRTLKLSIDLTEEFTSETESAGIDILFPRSKIASLWFLSGTGELGLIVDDTPPSITTSDGTTPAPDDTTPPLDDTPPADIPETIALTVTTEQASYTTGDEIIISGTVGQIIEDLPVVLQIKTATDLVGIAQIVPESDGTFTHFILADGPLWLADNTITVKAFYGGNNVDEITLEFTA